MNTAFCNSTIPQKLSLRKQLLFLKTSFTAPSFENLVGIVRSVLKHSKAGNLSRMANDIDKCISTVSHFFNGARWNIGDVREMIREKLLSSPLTKIEDGDIAAFDESSISKKGDTFEFIGETWDNAEKEIHDGYSLMACAIVSKKKKTRYLFDEILFSNKDPKFKSIPSVVLRILKRLFARTNISTVVFDRGFRNAHIVKYIVNAKRNFIVRATGSMVIWSADKKRCCFSDIKTMDGARFENLTVEGKTGWSVAWYTGVVNAWTRTLRVPFTVIVVARPSFRYPMILITNLPIGNSKEAFAIYETYLNRWKIEILFQDIKALGLETFRVRSKKAIMKYFIVVILIHSFLTLQLAWTRGFASLETRVSALLRAKRKIPKLLFGGMKILYELLFNRVIFMRNLGENSV